MRLFKCKHDWKAVKESNALQLDDMGYPLRLYIYRCSKCGKLEQKWMDVCVEQIEELRMGKSVLVTWSLI